jgi:hypothetical protein
MPFLAQFLQSDAINLLGWVLIAAGLALAVDTLTGIRRPRSSVVHIFRAYRAADWSASQSARTFVRPMPPVDQWQRLSAIIDSDMARSQNVLELHAQATLQLESVDDGMSELLAAWREYRSIPPQPDRTAVAPVPSTQPLAA